MAQEKEIIENETVLAQEIAATVEVEHATMTETEHEVVMAEVEHEQDAEAHEEHEATYSHLNKEEILAVTGELTKEVSFRKVDTALRLLKVEIDRMNKAEREAALQKFLADGGEVDNFEFKQDETSKKFFAQYKSLKEKKAKYFDDIEKKKANNLTSKNEALKQLKDLVESGKTDKAAFERLKEIQTKWKEAGQIAPQQSEGLYESYKALLDRFYSQKNIENELLDLDRKRNLVAKLELCDKAEKLAEVLNINEAVAQLNRFHEEYKAVGPAPKEDQEAIWQRFKLASDKVYERKRNTVEEIKKEQAANMKLKQELCLKIEVYPEFVSTKIGEWNTKTQEILALQDEWEKVGPAPREVAKDLNKQFWTNFKAFFANKTKFFEQIEKAREDNLKAKIALCEQAEGLKESNNWDEVTEELKKLQTAWKEIGPVPEKQKDSIYERFKAACDGFFERKRNRRADQDKEFDANLAKKQAICEQIEAMAKAKETDVKKLEEQQSAFSAVGFVPRKNMTTIQDRFAKAIDDFLANVQMNATEKEKVKFGMQLKVYENTPNAAKKVKDREQTLRKRIMNIENDIALWKNNLEFFAQSKTADRLRTEFGAKIAEASKELNDLKVELKALQQQA
jgi:hypothetical protein